MRDRQSSAPDSRHFAAALAREWERQLVLVPLAGAFCLPLAVMIIASLKDIREVMTTGLLDWPRHLIGQPWREAWANACIGISCEGLHVYFVNSLLIAVPATILSMGF